MSAIAPGSTLGILGGGQLGRMLAGAAGALGYRSHIYTPEKNAPASQFASETTLAAYDDEAALERFAGSVDVVTLEFENVPAQAVKMLEAHHPVRPGSAVLHITQHRAREKEFVRALGIGTAPFEPVTSRRELQDAGERIGYPCILKTSEMGYDGKGQARLDSAAGLDAAWQACGGDCILEGFVTFEMEISVIVARGTNGSMATYDPVQNIHRHHILAETIAPAPISRELAALAQDMARRIAEGINLTGLLAVEMFVTSGGGLLVNELAPRPHNSGHWTLDACATSQFEQAVRAACGLPLGSTQRLCDARMINLIGGEADEWPRYAAMPNARLHLYGKTESRPGRKMGHVTFLTLPN